MEAPIAAILLFVDFVGFWGGMHHVAISVPWWGGLIGWLFGNLLMALAWRYHQRHPADIDLAIGAILLSFPTAMAAGFAMSSWGHLRTIDIGYIVWLTSSLLVGGPMAAFVHPHHESAPYVLGWGAFPLAMISRLLSSGTEVSDHGH